MTNIISTDAQVRSAKVKPGQTRSDFSVDGVAGLRLRVTSNGVRTFRLESRKAGKVTLGTYPSTSLSDARRAAGILIAEADRAKVNGATGTKVLATQDRRTLAELLDRYEADAGKNLSSWHEERAAIAYRYDPATPLAKLSEQAMLAPVRRDNNVAAKRACRYLSTVLRWADAGHPIPNGKLDELVPEVSRERVLSDTELRAVIHASSKLTPLWRDYCLGLIYSMRRSGELCAAAVEHIDFDAGVWQVRIFKVRGRGHKVEAHPISTQLAEILQKRGVTAGHIYATAAGKPLSNNFDRTLKRLHELSGTSGWSWHDLRRTSRTLMGRAGVRPEISERCMSHALTGAGRMAAVYDRYDYLDEMREAYQALGDKIDSILAL
ncbi:hypothetical protein SuNHUV7_22260 (plasmid) [Pseudoseohaeicola sp. NH-UV-7]|uniref:tyrosine-type recombinase/integrase n=1 Tax=Sulfitobacter sp. TBRI5 TaxID=2989732 RepID=UPI003A6777AF